MASWVRDLHEYPDHEFQHVGLRAAFGVGAVLSAFSIPYFLWAEKRFLLGRAQPSSPIE